MAIIWAIFLIGIASTAIESCHGAQYFGKLIGKLSQLHHGVSGEVYAVDVRTLYIKDFTYDGQGPAAYFYASVHKAADKNGFRLTDEKGNGAVIRRYRKEGITITLPEGKTLHNVKIFYLWCEEFSVNFGDVKIPKNFDYPKPQKIDPLIGVHAISSDNVIIVDAQTLLIPNFSYDGEAPDAKFWAGQGNRPTPQGFRIPDENGKESPLRKYDRKTVVLTLPGHLTVFDIGHFGIWCEEFTVDFGHILIPRNLNIPPSLKMLGVSAQKLRQIDGSLTPSTTVSYTRPLIGGHLQPTTYRPSSLSSFSGIERRNINQNQPNYNNFLPRQSKDLSINDEQFRIAQLTQQIPYQQQVQNPQVYHQQVQNSLVYQQASQQPHRFQQPQHNYNQQNVEFQQSISLPISKDSISRSYQIQQYSNNPNFVNIPQYPQYNRQYDEQLVYNRILQQKKLQEEQQLQEQLNRQFNRFQLNGNYNAYNQLG